MFDVDALKNGALSKMNELILRCREGGFTGDRGSRAMAITQEEARTAAFNHPALWSKCHKGLVRPKSEWCHAC